MSRQWDLQDQDLIRTKFVKEEFYLTVQIIRYVTEQLKYRFTDSILPQMYDTTLNGQTDSS